MKYTTRFSGAKILISSAILALVTSSILGLLAFRDDKLIAYVNGDQVYFAVTLAIMTCALAVPLLYLVWAKLHGTGRGVRMAGFIAFIIALAPIMSVSLTRRLISGDALHDTYYIVSHGALHIGILTALALGLLLSIKGKGK